MMKKFLKPLVIVIILAMSLSLVSCGGFSQLLLEDFSFVLNEDGQSYTLEMVGGKNLFAESITIPDTYNGLPVTEIGSGSFALCTNVKHVVIPDSVIVLHPQIFLTNLKIETIEIPDSVMSISGDLSIPYSEMLEYNEYKGGLYVGGKNNPYLILARIDESIRDTITSFEIHPNTRFIYGASGMYEVTSITIPDSVISICELAFQGNISLTSIEIPNSVKNIDNRAFSNCYSLASINISASVSSIGDNVFEQCLSLLSIEVDENNEYFKSIDGNLYSKDGKTLIKYAGAKEATSFTVPDFVTHIEGGAFDNSYSLTNLNLPDNIISCSSMSYLNVKYNEYNGAKYLGNENNPYLALIYAPGAATVEVHSDTKVISSRAFSGSNVLTSIVLPDSLVRIGDGAFYGCTALKSVVIPNSVISIGEKAFDGCTALKSVVIPNSVISIGEKAFADCDSLTVYCEASSKPEGWSPNWNLTGVPIMGGIRAYSDKYIPVVWGYTGK